MRPRTARVDHVLKAHESFGFSGAAALIGPDGPLLRAGYGIADHAAGRVCRTSTLFDIGSVSKQFTATAVVMLAERGRLAFDDPIGRHLPAVPDDKASITLHDILTHRSGLIRNHADTDFVEMTLEEAVDRILRAPSQRPPGAAYEYSNAGYTLLAAVVEHAAGTPFIDFVREKLFAAAGMDRTGFYRDHPVNEYASGYDGYDGTLDYGSPGLWVGPSFAVVGNGAVVSCIDDLIMWETALRTDLLLAPRSRRLLETPHTEEYGYGWRCYRSERDGRIVRHGGANAVFNCEYRRMLDQDLTLILLANRSSEQCMLLPPITDRVTAAIAGHAAEGSPPESVVGPADELTGTWTSEDGHLTFLKRDGRTYLTGAGVSLLARVTETSPNVVESISRLLEDVRHVHDVEPDAAEPPSQDGFFLDEPASDGSQPAAVARTLHAQVRCVLGDETLSDFGIVCTIHVGPFDEHRAYVTYIKVVGTSGTEGLVRLLWFDGPNLAAALDGERHPLEWAVRAAPGGGHVTYDPMTGVTVRFDLTAGGMEVTVGPGRFTAIRGG